MAATNKCKIGETLDLLQRTAEIHLTQARLEPQGILPMISNGTDFKLVRQSNVDKVIREMTESVHKNQMVV